MAHFVFTCQPILVIFGRHMLQDTCNKGDVFTNSPCTVCVTTLCLRKTDTDVTHYRFNPHQPISVIFGRDVAERVRYRMVIDYPTSPN